MTRPRFMVRFKKPPVKSFLEPHHARQTVISRNSVTPRVAFAHQDGHLAREFDDGSHRAWVLDDVSALLAASVLALACEITFQRKRRHLPVVTLKRAA